MDLEQRGLLPTAVFGDSIESWVTAMFSATHFSPRCDSLLLDSAEECEMAVKLMVMYPRPKDIVAFERLYNRVHAPMTEDILPGKTMIVATKVLGAPRGAPPFHRIVEIHFPSMVALETCAASKGCKQTLAHALAISTGGAPTVLIAEEETQVFDQFESRTLGTLR